MDILTSTDFPIVRHKIDYRLTDTDLPDALVQEFVDEAETEVKTLVKNHDQLDTAGTNRLKLATIYWAAYLLADAVPILVREGVTPQFERHFEASDHEKKMERLMDTRDKHLAFLDVDESAPILFELDESYKDKLRRAEYRTYRFDLLKYIGEKRRGFDVYEDRDA